MHLCNRLNVCFRPSRRSTIKTPGCRSASLHGRKARRSRASGKTLPPGGPGRNVLLNGGQHPRIRASSYVVFHIHLAPLSLGPRSAIGHIRRVHHQRRSGLDRHLQLKSSMVSEREKRLSDTQHRVKLVELPKAVLLRRSARPLLWRTSNAPDASGSVGASALPRLVSIHLRPTGLRPVRARASAPCPTNAVFPFAMQF